MAFNNVHSLIAGIEAHHLTLAHLCLRSCSNIHLLLLLVVGAAAGKAGSVEGGEAQSASSCRPGWMSGQHGHKNTVRHDLKSSL